MKSFALFSAFDRSDLLERLGHDEDFVTEILAMCVEEVDGKVTAIERAIACGDLSVVGKLAHALKGVTANTSAHRLSAIASELELASKQSRLDLARTLALSLRPETDEFKQAIAADYTTGIGTS